MARLRDICVLSSLITMLMLIGGIAFANESLCQKFTDTELYSFRELQEFYVSRSPLYLASNVLPALSGIAAAKLTSKKMGFNSAEFTKIFNEWRKVNPRSLQLKNWDPSIRLPGMLSHLLGLEYAHIANNQPFQQFSTNSLEELKVLEVTNRNKSFDPNLTGEKTSKTYDNIVKAIIEVDQSTPRIREIMDRIIRLQINAESRAKTSIETNDRKYLDMIENLREDLREQRFIALKKHPVFKKMVGMLDPMSEYYKGNFRGKVLYSIMRGQRIYENNLSLFKNQKIKAATHNITKGAISGAVGGSIATMIIGNGTKKLLQAHAASDAQNEIKKCPNLKFEGWDKLYLEKGYINIVNCKPELSIYGEEFVLDLENNEDNKKPLPKLLKDSAIVCDAYLGLTEKKLKALRDVITTSPEITCGENIEIHVKDEKCGKNFYYKIERNDGIVSIKSGFVPGEKNLTKENSFNIDVAVNRNELDLFFNIIRTEDLAINQTIPATPKLESTLYRSNPLTFLDPKNELDKCDYLKTDNEVALPGNTYFKMVSIRKAVLMGKLFLVDAMEKCNWNRDSFKLVVPGFESSHSESPARAQ